jgi:hypothetical protein
MKNPGDLICMALAAGFVFLVINAKAQRAGGWGNYLLGFAIMFGLLIGLGLVMKACKAIF